jgi:hypothetical protein
MLILKLDRGDYRRRLERHPAVIGHGAPMLMREVLPGAGQGTVELRVRARRAA